MKSNRMSQRRPSKGQLCFVIREDGNMGIYTYNGSSSWMGGNNYKTFSTRTMPGDIWADAYAIGEEMERSLQV